jgi:hypothetical protein
MLLHQILHSTHLVKLREVGIALGHSDVLVAHELLHGFDVHACHNELAAEGVA